MSLYSDMQEFLEDGQKVGRAAFNQMLLENNGKKPISWGDVLFEIYTCQSSIVKLGDRVDKLSKNEGLHGTLETN